MVPWVPGCLLWMMSLVQGEGCVGAAPIGADAEALKAAGSICALGSLDWLSPDTCLPALVSSQEGLLGLHLAFSLTGSNLSFLIKAQPEMKGMNVVVRVTSLRTRRSGGN